MTKTRTQIFFGLLVSFALSSCASVQNKSDEAVAQVLREDKKSEKAAARGVETLTLGEVIRLEEPNTQTLYDNSRYDFPITINSRVEGWMDYFTGRGRHHMERYLARSSRYIPVMKEILKRHGLPEDLVYLALIESGFNLRAKSRARAVGPWQFMKATGQRYGLRVNAWIDERRDPLRSTEAAAGYLKDLYLMFESWYLAAAAYNAGEYKILRAIDSAKTNNFWNLTETKLIRRETKDYIPKLIAAAIIAKNPKRYGFDDIAWAEPLNFEAVTVHYPIRLSEVAKMADASDDDLEELNPHLVKKMVPSNMPVFDVRVPPGTKKVLDRALASNRTELTARSNFKEHVVKSGETLSSIARKYSVRLRTLANTNNLGSKEKINPGMQLLIPGKETAAFERADSYVPTTKPDETGFVIHTVKSGESLWSISELYDVTVQKIFQWNDLNRSRIHPGKKLKIKVEAKASSGARNIARNSRS